MVVVVKLVIKMAYGKEDFIDFSDLDLDELLGEFTSSEVENSDDDCHTESNSNVTAKQKTVRNKTYQCNNCDKKYASISGLRGHLRAKHGISSVKVSEYRHGSKTEKEQKPFSLDESDFSGFFDNSFTHCLDSMQNNSLRKKATSGPGKLIVDTSKKVSLDSDIKTTIEHKLRPHFFKVFENANSSEGNTNENLYSTFYKVTEDAKLSSEIQDVLKRISDENFRPFVGVLLHTLMRSLIRHQAELFERRKDENIKPLDNNDQLVIFYISGYIIRTLKRKCSKPSTSKSMKLQALREAMRLSLKNESDSEKTFVNQYSEWTCKTNRGGLKIPSDCFFLLIRECEMCCREEIDEKNLHKYSLNRTILCETILDRFMVKYYADKLFSGEFASFMLESCVKLFLTVRGHAWARKRKSEDKNQGNTKALRKSLMEYSKT